MRCLIIEGITGTGKSTIYEKLCEKLMVGKQGGNILFLNEYMTWRTFEKEKDVVQGSKEMLNGIVVFFQWLRTKYIMADLENTSCGQYEQISCLFEGFHWNAFVRNALSEAQFHHLEKMLHEMEFSVILLTLSDEKIKERSVNETRLFRTGGWSKYLETLGDSDEEVANFFKQRQEKYYNIYFNSILPKIEIKTDEKKWDDYVEQIIKWEGKNENINVNWSNRGR